MCYIFSLRACVDGLLEVDVLVVVVVVVAVDSAVDVRHSVEYREGHPGEHQWDKLGQLGARLKRM
jgi:hypothetical protein